MDSHVAESLFEVAKKKYGVNFGNGEYGWCFQIGKKYFWLAPVLQKPNSEPNSEPWCACCVANRWGICDPRFCPTGAQGENDEDRGFQADEG